MKIEDKISSLNKGILGELRTSTPYKKSGKLLVPAKPRWDTKWRFLAYRFRKKVEELIPGNNNATPGHWILKPSELVALDTLSEKLRQVINPIEAAFNVAIQNKSDEERLDITKAEARLKRGRFAARLNRTIFIWEILWGLAATREEIVDFSGNLVIQPSSYSPDDDFLELIERRLRKIERMRYNVPGSSAVEVPLMEFFTYPGGNNSGVIGGDSYDPSNDENSEWEMQGSSSTNFDLKASDVLGAVNRIFEVPTKTIGGRIVIDNNYLTQNYCDKVIQILHLDEMVGHIERTGQRSLIPDKKDIKIIAGITFSPNLLINSNSIVGTGLVNDRFFERKTIRLDELVPGDHFILKNHPFYQIFTVKGSAWRLENAIVTRIRGNSIPFSIEVEGHGLGPYSFGDMQANLLKETRRAIILAQKKLILSASLSEALTKRSNQQNFTYWFQATHRGETYQSPIEFMNDFMDRPETISLFQSIDLDNQLSITQKESLRKKISLSAFSARCLIEPPSKSIFSEDIFKEQFSKKYLENEYQHINPADASMKDSKISPAYWKIPFIENLKVLVGSKTLILEGINLEKEKIRGVFFVASPRYHVMPTGGSAISGYTVDPSSDSMITRLGKWTDPASGNESYEIKEEPNLTFDRNGKFLNIKLPDNFSFQELWHPVLRINMFDPTDSNLQDFFPGFDLSGKSIDWFESQDETSSNKLKQLKDGIASLQFFVRGEMRFLWPYNGPEPELTLGSVVDSNPLGEYSIKVEGHGRFNVLFFPLFRMRTLTGATLNDRIKMSRINMRPIKSFMTEQITNFYNMNVPESTTTIIRSKIVEPAPSN